MAIFSSFADEIDPDPRIQVQHLQANGIGYVDLRGAWDTNVMKLSNAQCADLRTIFADGGIGVACIGSPIGKVTVDSDLDAHFDQFKHAVDQIGRASCRERV